MYKYIFIVVKLLTSNVNKRNVTGHMTCKHGGCMNLNVLKLSTLL